MDLFEVEREGGRERACKHAEVAQRMLLWHGSRLTNWVGILFQVAGAAMAGAHIGIRHL